MLAEADAKYAERRTELGEALARAGCDLYECTAAFLFFQLTRGGLSPAEISYDELTWRPYRLCCSYATARRTVEKLIRLGIVQPRATSTRGGHRGKNRYIYDADAVRSIRLGTSPARLLVEQASAQVEQASAHEKRRQSEEEKDLVLEPNQEYNPLLHSLPAQPANLQAANGPRRVKGFASSMSAGAGASALVDEVAADASAEVATNQEETWLQAERMLRSAGLRGVDKALSQARDRRVPPQVVCDLVEFYRAHKGSWHTDPGFEVGVIFPAIRAWRPGARPGDEDDTGHWLLWPTAERRKIVAAAAAACKERELLEAQQRNQATADERAHAEREARLGPKLDGLTDDQRRDLIGQCGMAGYLRKLEPDDPALRRVLLKLLEEQE